MNYKHTQHGIFHYVMYLIAGGILVAAWWVIGETAEALTRTGIGVLVLAVGFCFESLTVADAGDRLQLTYGPLPLICKSFRYADIQSAESGKSNWIDGWGVHWVPGRGWTYNLWGFDCAVLRIKNRTVRIGTDEPDRLVSFLRERIGQP